MCICVTVSDTSVVEGESQIQMGRFISFLQVGDESFLSSRSLLKSRKRWQFPSLSFDRNCPVLYRDVMKWWSTWFISWLPSTTATSKIRQQCHTVNALFLLVGLKYPRCQKRLHSHADTTTTHRLHFWFQHLLHVLLCYNVKRNV